MRGHIYRELLRHIYRELLRHIYRELLRHIYRELLRHIYRELLRPDYVMQQYKPGCKLCSREHACSIQHCLGDRLVYQGGGGVMECILQECTAMGGPRGLQTGVWPW
jgi:sulfatase maturation enzyme AslB (radical SAM superfamily)